MYRPINAFLRHDAINEKTRMRTALHLFHMVYLRETRTCPQQPLTEGTPPEHTTQQQPIARPDHRTRRGEATMNGVRRPSRYPSGGFKGRANKTHVNDRVNPKRINKIKNKNHNQ